jgi:hypothetical protein
VSAKEVDSSGGGASPSALAKVVGSRLRCGESASTRRRGGKGGVAELEEARHRGARGGEASREEEEESVA